MWSIIHQQVIKLIRLNNILLNRHILLALSGGQDSLCLLKIFLDIDKLYMLSIDIVHFNHHWRSDSKQNMCLISQLSFYWRIARYLYQLPTGFLEELESRQWRYKVLYFLSMQKSNTTIITAHTATDKVEVFLLNLFRGSAPESLTSLVAFNELSPNFFISRPLLCSNRRDISWFCRKFFLPVWSDATNYDYKIARNRIREEMMPYIRKYFNLRIEKHISYILASIYNDYEYLQYIALYFYFKYRHLQYVALHKKMIILLHPSIKYRVFKILLKNFYNKNIYSQISTLLLEKKSMIYAHILCSNSIKIALCVHTDWIYLLSTCHY